MKRVKIKRDRFRRIIVFFLAFAMVFSGILPVDALADEQELYVVSELIEYRDAYTKTFVMSDNTISSVTMSQPIHFLDNETGEWEEIDNTLNTVETAEG